MNDESSESWRAENRAQLDHLAAILAAVLAELSALRACMERVAGPPPPPPRYQGPSNRPHVFTMADGSDRRDAGTPASPGS